MVCDDCMKIMCMYRGKRKNCTEIIKIKDMKVQRAVEQIKKEGYLDFEGMR